MSRYYEKVSRYYGDILAITRKFLVITKIFSFLRERFHDGGWEDEWVSIWGQVGK